MKQIETERKYIIVKPNSSVLKKQKNYTESQILQIYLNDDEQTHRIRKRVFTDGRTEYTENTKKRISLLSSLEIENNIDFEQFEALRKNIEPLSRPIEKTRITFEFLGKTFEIDVYPEWKYTCILEVELDSENEKIEFPKFIKIIADVTGKKEYSNHRMSHAFPDERAFDSKC